MGNRERYRRCFDKIQPPEELTKELYKQMDKKHTHSGARKALVLAAAVVTIAAMAVAASAAGIFDQVRIWIGGQEVEAEPYVSVDASGNTVVEVTGAGEEIKVALGESDEDTPDIQAEFIREDGRYLLRFTNAGTGETEDVDITDATDNWENCDYTAIVEVFGCTCDTELTITNGKAAVTLTVTKLAQQ